MQSSYVYVNGIRVHYLHWNLTGEGQPVILLHGLASNARIWELVAPYLAQADMPVLAPDLRGHGLTDKPEGDYSLEAFIQDIAACVDTWNLERPLIVGHSWGAMLALGYAARFNFGPRAPAGGALIDGGVVQLNDAPESLPVPTWEKVLERLTPPRLAGMPLADFLARLEGSFPNGLLNEELIPIILANFEIREEGPQEGGGDSAPPGQSSEVVERIYPRLKYEHHMQIVRAMWEFDVYEAIRRVRCPVLALPSIPPEPRNEREQEFLQMKQHALEKAKALTRQLQVHWLEDTIHDSPLQRPAELSKLIRGLSPNKDA
jgi:pimeloyl-ACP methyl ester carboxylesterase